MSTTDGSAYMKLETLIFLDSSSFANIFPALNANSDSHQIIVK